MLKVIELFSGIGAQAAALENLNIEHEIIGISEINQNAINAYYKIHKKCPNLGDIKKIIELPKCDLLTYSFPCTDISSAGTQKGIKEGTQSGLLLEVKRLLENCYKNNKLPKYLLLENVEALVQKKFIKDFEEWLNFLRTLGYETKWEVLNAKDFGCPQSRKRVYGVSILGDNNFKFPVGNKQVKFSEIMTEDESLPSWTLAVSKEMSIGVLENLPDKNKIYVIDNIYHSRPTRFYEEYAPTITASNASRLLVWDSKKLRRLDIQEAYKCMGFSNRQYDLLKTGKRTVDGRLAGNSICVPVLEAIFSKLFKGFN